MRLGRLAIAIWTLLLGSQGIAAPLQQSENLTVGPTPSSLAIDAINGRVVIGNAGASRGQPGSVSVLDRSGKLTTVATSSGPVHVAVSSARRKAFAAMGFEDRVAIIHLDTLATASAPTGKSPLKTVIDDRSGKAYVIGRTLEMDMSTGWPRATSTVHVTVIDIATAAAQTYSSVGFAPEDAVLSPDGKRLYVMGSHYFRTGEEKPGFVQAFDVESRTFAGAPLMLGRVPKQILVSPRGDKVFVVGHTDYARTDLDPADMRRNSVRGAVFVLDAATMALERSIQLPDTRNLNLFGPVLTPQAQVDPATGFVHVVDRNNAFLAIVDPARGTLAQVTDFEAPATAFAINAQAGTIVVSLPSIGQAAILSRGGTRLDSVPVGRAPLPNVGMGQYAVAVDAGTGDTYMTNGHDQSISILRRNGEAGALVNLTDVWFDAADPGWGLFVDHQGIVLFATLFIHDAAGDPTWLAMSSGVRQPDGSFSGVLYRTHGPVTKALTDITPVGIMRITPEAGGTAKLLYVVDGQSRTRVVQRFDFEAGARECGWGVGTAKSSLGASNFTSLWSDPREQGWGVAVSHRGGTVFGVLFSYDAESRPSWSVMSNGRQQAPGLFSGDLYRAKRGRLEMAGTMTLDFTGPDAGTVRFHVDGVDFRSQITRQALTPLMSRCASQ